jgi:sulfoxide reductase heme-binding subunit YedZ
VHFSAWFLVTWLVTDYLLGNLTINPIQAATQRTGKYALIFLILSLACTPLNTLFGMRQVLAQRRWLGLYAFMFAAIHLTIFIGWDYGFDFSLLSIEFLQKRYVIVGSAAFLILFPLAITSFRWWLKRLGKKWKWLHRLVYLAGGLVIIHYAWAKKGDLFRLQGDIWQPLLFGLLLIFLLVLRIPPVRKFASSLRTRIKRKRASLATS